MTVLDINPWSDYPPLDEMDILTDYQKEKCSELARELSENLKRTLEQIIISRRLSEWLYSYCSINTGFYPTDKSMDEMAEALLKDWKITGQSGK